MRFRIPKLKATAIADILFRYQPLFDIDIEKAQDKIDKCWPPDAWRQKEPCLLLPTTEEDKKITGFQFNSESPSLKRLIRDLMNLGAIKENE
jgi:hypothetical protein